MSSVIVYTRPDGGMSIIVPAPKFLAQFDTEIDGLAAVQAKSVPPNATDVQIVDRTTIPLDRTFRDAWRQAGGAVSVDMPAARVIHAERIAVTQIAEIARLKVEERKERLKANTTQADQHAADIVAVEALDLNALATQIAAQSTPETLKAVWPAMVPR